MSDQEDGAVVAPGPGTTVLLPAGRRLEIRPLQRGDEPWLVALFAGLDDDDCYFRFFSGHPPPSRFVERLVSVGERGGYGLVAVVHGTDGTTGVVAEAAYEPVGDGDAELGITVAREHRGWLGPYLLDVLVGEAAARGVRNLTAQVLASNRRMFRLLGSRGYVVIGHDNYPAVVHVAIGVEAPVATWAPRHARPRVLVEAPGGRWHAEEAARSAGFDVKTCPGNRPVWRRCPALAGSPCPLAAGADVIVQALAPEDGAALVAAHHTVHGRVPICVEGLADVEADAVVSDPGDDVIAVIRRLLDGRTRDGASATPTRGPKQRLSVR